MVICVWLLYRVLPTLDQLVAFLLGLDLGSLAKSWMMKGESDFFYIHLVSYRYMVWSLGSSWPVIVLFVEQPNA